MKWTLTPEMLDSYIGCVQVMEGLGFQSKTEMTVKSHN